MKKETIQKANVLLETVNNLKSEIEVFQKTIENVKSKNDGIPWLREHTSSREWTAVQLNKERYITLLYMEIAVRQEQLTTVERELEELAD